MVPPSTLLLKPTTSEASLLLSFPMFPPPIHQQVLYHPAAEDICKSVTVSSAPPAPALGRVWTIICLLGAGHGLPAFRVASLQFLSSQRSLSQTLGRAQHFPV